MKNKSKEPQNTVWLDEKSMMYSNQEIKINPLLLRCITLLLCVFSVLVTLKIAIELPINLPIVLLTVSFCVLFTFAQDMKKYKSYVIVGSVILLFLVIYLFHKDLYYALFIIRSNFMKAYNRYYSTNYLTYNVAIPFMSEYEWAKTIFMIVFSYILSNYFASRIKKKKGLIPLIILFLPLFWGSVNFGFKPHIIPILLMLFSFIAVYAYESRSNNWLKRKPNSNDKSKSKNRHIAHFPQGKNLNTCASNRNWISALTLTASIIILIVMIFPESSYKPNEKLEFIYNDPTTFIMGLKDKISIEKVPMNFSSSGVSGGDLNTIDRKGFANVTHLKVMSNSEVPMLLKGYVGSVYGGNRWTDLDDSIYAENEEVFLGLSSFDITPHTIMTPYLDGLMNNQDSFKALLDSENDVVINTDIFVENVRANEKYRYVPYGLKEMGTDETVFIRDTIVSGEGVGRGSRSRLLLKQDGSYSITDMQAFHNYSSEALYELTVNQGLRDAISKYEKFVYEYYLTMPSDRLEKIKEDFVPTKDVNTAIQSVKNYLNSHAVYDLAPGKKPRNKDYIEYFLYENHKGYCSHFATAATMMFRAMGIPARYVEGYTVTQYDINFNRSIGGEILINDSNAHAWTEIYLPMYGWVPVDVTPGSSAVSIADPVSNSSVPEEMQSSSNSSSNVSSELSEVSSSVSSENNSSSSTSEETTSTQKIGKVGIVFFTFIGILAAFFLLFRLKYAIVASKRRSTLSQKNINQAVMSGYAYLIEILSFIGYSKVVGETELEFAKRITRDCKFLEDDEFIDITELSLRAKFSNHSNSQEELEKVKEFSQKLNSDVYESLRYTDKLKYWFLDNLK